MTRTISFLIWLATMSSSAVANCFEPSPPSCASGYGPFDSEWEFDSCRRDVVAFQDDTEEYVACLQRDLEDEAERIQREAESEIEDASEEAGSLADSAVSEAARVVDDFNDRADD